MEDREAVLQYTIPQLLRWRVQRSADKVALREKDFGYWNTLTWREYYDYVHKTALGLEKIGLKKDDKLALITDNIPEMLIVAIGAQAIGAISAGIYQTSLPDEIADILDYMDVGMVFCDDQEQVDKLMEVRDRIPKVKKVLYEDPRGMRSYRSDDWFMFIDDLYALGEKAREENPERFDKLVDEGHPEDVCHFCLTSGTTGLPKAAMLTHLNYINMGLRLTEIDHLEPDDEYVSFLPFAWIGEQMNSFGVALATGITINFPESVETAMEDLKEIGPHFMFGAPRIYETLQSQIWLKIDESYWLKGLIPLLHEGRQAGGHLSHVRKEDAALFADPMAAGKSAGIFAVGQSDRNAAAAQSLYRRGRAGARSVYLLSGAGCQPEANLRANRNYGDCLHAPGRRCSSRNGRDSAARNRVQDFRGWRDPFVFTVRNQRVLQNAGKNGGIAARRMAAFGRRGLYRRKRASGRHRPPVRRDAQQQGRDVQPHVSGKQT